MQGTAGAVYSGAGLKPAGSRPRCSSARRGLTYYRIRASHWKILRGVEAEVRIAQPRGCAHTLWLAKEWRSRAWKARQSYYLWLERRYLRHPREIALELLGGDRKQWGCLMSIVWVENRTMDPTLDFGGGHGNVYEAYGIPQANPGHKMSSAGPDWRTNPETQLRWMIGYCRGRYGSVCGAAAARRAKGWY